MKRSLKILIIMVACAFLATAFGFFVLSSRTSPLPQANLSQDQIQDESAAEPEPEEQVLAVVIPSTWSTYANDRHGFTVKHPPTLKAGVISENSVLGTFQIPVRGFHVGPLVFVVLKDAELRAEAQEYFNGTYNATLNPPEEDLEFAVFCEIDGISNPNVTDIKSVSCEGEGGAAKYAYIQGPEYDVFVDGYSKGYGNQDNGEIQTQSDYINILSSFRFGLDTVVQASTESAQSKILNFVIEADDSGATPAEITATKDAIVQITFNVSASNVNYGSLDFRSSVVNSGAVSAGGSKTISFKAAESFHFTPYWPSVDIARDYKISVLVQ